MYVFEYTIYTTIFCLLYPRFVSPPQICEIRTVTVFDGTYHKPNIISGSFVTAVDTIATQRLIYTWKLKSSTSVKWSGRRICVANIKPSESRISTNSRAVWYFRGTLGVKIRHQDHPVFFSSIANIGNRKWTYLGTKLDVRTNNIITRFFGRIETIYDPFNV